MKLSIQLCVAAVLLFPIPLFAQGGVSSGSFGVARAGFHTVDSSGQYVLPSPKMFRVEEFINYHRHDLPLPTDGQRVLLNVQDLKLENGKTVFQFGLTTPRAMDIETMQPLNIVLVVDESGSMSGDKIKNSRLHLAVLSSDFGKLINLRSSDSNKNRASFLSRLKKQSLKRSKRRSKIFMQVEVRIFMLV